MPNSNLHTFRQYNENDVVNFFALHSDDIDDFYSRQGSLVTLEGASGFVSDDLFNFLSINNGTPKTVSDRWIVKSNVRLGDAGKTVFGMMLHNTKEEDENREKLINNPRKAHEMQVSMKGQSVPILTRGIVLVRGIIDATEGEPFTPGTKLYGDDFGRIMRKSNLSNEDKKAYVGYSLGTPDANDWVLIMFDPHDTSTP